MERNQANTELTKNKIKADDQTQPTFEMTPGFKPFTVSKRK